MLELDDIQGPSVFGYKMPYGRFLFLHLESASAGATWLGDVIPTVTTAQPRSHLPLFCVNVGFTHAGLKAMGVAQTSLDTFENAFREGIANRSFLLGDTGSSAPENWVGGGDEGEAHALILIFAVSRDALEDASGQQRAFMAGAGGVTELHALDAAALPERKEHFGYRDAISHVILEGTEKAPKPGDWVVKPGEFVLGYEDESGRKATVPQPEVLGRNGSFYVYRRLYQDVALWRNFLVSNAGAQGPEFLAAKMMGRWRSGAPLMLAPKADDLALANDEQRNGNFKYMVDDQGREADPIGLICPRGAHIRRVNPRDDLATSEQKRHLLMRRGLPYGPPLPEGAVDDGQDRGIAGVFVCASIQRQFEFVQEKWINNRTFHDLDNDKDPIVGDHDGSSDMTIPAKPFRRKLRGLPRFTIVKDGGYFFAPGIRALRYLADNASQ